MEVSEITRILCVVLMNTKKGRMEQRKGVQGHKDNFVPAGVRFPLFLIQTRDTGQCGTS